MRFFGARSPSKIAFIGAKGAFRKILGSVSQKWNSEKVSKGGPFGSAGDQIPVEGRPPTPPPINPPLYIYIYTYLYNFSFVICRDTAMRSNLKG